jgi:hypothetical protein
MSFVLGQRDLAGVKKRLPIKEYCSMMMGIKIV